MTTNFAYLDTLVLECERQARDQGWTGPWTLQVGDLAYVRGELDGRQLTPDEGRHLGIADIYHADVAWIE